MDPRSEVVLRQLDQLSGRVLFIHAPADQLLNQLGPQVQASIWTWNFSDYRYFQQAGFQAHFGVEFPDQPVDQVVIFVPKSKELLNYVLHQVVSHLTPGQNIFLVGEKKGGVERAAKQLQAFGQPLKLDSARHCQFWQLPLARTEQLRPLASWLKYYPVQFAGQQLEICALPGVFSQNHLDIGTAVLLPYLEQVKSGTLADFGCGAGVIACCLAKSNPANIIYALDVDAFALCSTALSFEHNQLPVAQLCLQPVSGIADAPVELDAIISNPPFHQGIHTHYGASEALCQTAPQHLKHGGELWIVANRFLNYPHLIEQRFGHCTIQTDQQGFKVLSACVR